MKKENIRIGLVADKDGNIIPEFVKTVKGKEKFYRLVALKVFKDSQGNTVLKGTKGGLVQDLGCISQDGNCWVDEKSVVIGSTVSGSALIEKSRVKNCQVGKSAHIADSAVEGGCCFGKVYSSSVNNSRILPSADISKNSVIDNAFIGGINEPTVVIDSSIKDATIYGNSYVLSSKINTVDTYEDCKIVNSVVMGNSNETKKGVECINREITFNGNFQNDENDR